jgi:fatty-acyl-CoA synthase
MLSVLFVGTAIILQLTFDAAATLQAIEDHRADDALFIPTMTMAVLDELESGEYDVSSRHNTETIT